MQKTKKVLSVECPTKNSCRILKYTHLQSLQSRVRYAHTAIANPTPKNGYRHYLALPTRHPKKDSKIVIERMKSRIQKYTIEKKSRSVWNATAYNGRFCEMAAVTPQKRQCEFGSYYPAGSLVKPPPRKAAGTLSASGGQHSGIMKRKIDRKM